MRIDFSPTFPFQLPSALASTFQKLIADIAEFNRHWASNLPVDEAVDMLRREIEVRGRIEAFIVAAHREAHRAAIDKAASAHVAACSTVKSKLTAAGYHAGQLDDVAAIHPDVASAKRAHTLLTDWHGGGMLKANAEALAKCSHQFAEAERAAGRAESFAIA
jgi:hypothetical protein